MPANLVPLDFRAIRAAITVQAALRRLGWQRVSGCRGGDRGPCPIHGSHSPSSRSLSVQPQRWYCHRCGAHGDVIDLWALVRRLPPLEAAYDLCRTFRLDPPVLRR